MTIKQIKQKREDIKLAKAQKSLDQLRELKAFAQRHVPGVDVLVFIRGWRFSIDEITAKGLLVVEEHFALSCPHEKLQGRLTNKLMALNPTTFDFDSQETQWVVERMCTWLAEVAISKKKTTRKKVTKS